MAAIDYKLLYESTLAAKQELEAQHKLLGDEVKRLKAERVAAAPLLVLLKKFDSIMEGCGNWPDTSTSQVNLGDLAAEVRDAIRKHEQKGGPIPDRLTFAGTHAVGGHSGHGGGLD